MIWKLIWEFNKKDGQTSEIWPAEGMSVNGKRKFVKNWSNIFKKNLRTLYFEYSDYIRI